MFHLHLKPLSETTLSRSIHQACISEAALLRSINQTCISSLPLNNSSIGITLKEHFPHSSC
jgi:hypothetical protein